MRLSIRPHFAYAVVLLAGLFGASNALGQACAQQGGKIFCGSPQPASWNVNACDEAGAFTARRIIWCDVRNGTWDGTGCINFEPDTDGNVVQRSIEFANAARNSSCSLTNDTGYGATWDASQTFCFGGGDAYQSGHLSLTTRRLTINCQNNTAETISIRKSRPVTCPPGSTEQPGGVCAAMLEDCAGCKVGNPVTPLTGIKVEAEVDYRHALGLQLSRHYHSLKFFEPFSHANGSHTESRLGIAWRTNFDKRVVVIQPQPQILKYGISLPTGEVQLFDASNTDLYNYGRGSGKLVPVTGVGYYYHAPELTEFYGTDGRLRTITQHSGQVLTLTYSDGTSGPNGGFIVDAAGNPTTFVLPANQLIRVTDSFGNALSFSLDIDGKIIVVTVPGGNQYRYGYDAFQNLTTVTYPDTRVRTYRYNEPANMVGGASLPNALTSIVDENASVFASFRYDASARVVSTEHAGGAQRYEFTYYNNGWTHVEDPLETVRAFGFVTNHGIAKFSGANYKGGAGYGSGVKKRTYDAAGNVSSQTNFNDVKTCYAYLAVRNLEAVRVEGLPSATTCSTVVAEGSVLPTGSRKNITEWHPRWRLPARISEPGRRTTFAYNGDPSVSCAPAGAVIDEGTPPSRPIGVLCSKTMQATTDAASGSQGFAATPSGTPRTLTFTYDALGRILTAKGARTDIATDITTYTYYADTDPDPTKRGNLHTISNAAGHLTTMATYNAHGQPLTVIDPNGITTTLAYDTRQRLTSRTVGTETTSYEYDPAGPLKKITLPDLSHLTYTYDAAHRLRQIADNAGNRIDYPELDGMGNRKKEEVRDPVGTLRRTLTRVYDGFNRLVYEAHP